MTTFVVEQTFEEPVGPDPLGAAESKAWCMTQYRVRPLTTYVSRDGRTTVGIYEAPDAESLRITRRNTGTVATSQTWPAHVLAPPGGDSQPAAHLVLLERPMPQTYAPEQLQALIQAKAFCFELYRARWITSYLAQDGSRMLCIFDAPDVDSVRSVNRQLGLPFERAFNVTVREERA